MWPQIILLLALGCTRSLTTTFDLRAVVSGDTMASVPLGISLGVGEVDVEGICKEPGMACQNCSHAITCVSLPGGWLKVPLEECVEGTTCNAHLGKCSTQPVPECEARQSQHTCEQVGIFPDAYDCRKFHLCSPPDDLPTGRPADRRTAMCPRHYGYDPQTAQCSVKLRRGQCSHKPVPTCITLGQADVLPTSPNHYYVCLQRHSMLYPQVFICPHGWYFWERFCHPEPQNIQEEKLNQNESATNSEKDSSTTQKTVRSTTEKTISSSTEKTAETTSRIDSFFSTDKSTTYAADTFLADKFDLTNYETIDDAASNNNDDFANSFETGNDFW